MNILVTINDNYMEPLQVMLASLFRHETEPIDVYLIHSSVSEENLDFPDSYISSLGGRFIPVFARESIFENAPDSRYFPKEMYYRLLCGELLPETLKRVLYLDPDIMIRGPVHSLYETDFQGQVLLGSPDTPAGKTSIIDGEHKARLGLCENDVYVNSGVLLMNLPKIRETFVLEDFLRQAEKRRDVLKFPDQDMINVTFKGKIGVINQNYNYMARFFDAADTLSWLTGEWRKENPVVVHYAGSYKPWNANYICKYYFEYRKYHKKLQDPKERFLFPWKHIVCYVREMFRSIRRVFLRDIKSKSSHSMR